MIQGKKIAVVIPARYGSTRFEGKPLARLLDKPMIWHVYEGAKKCELIDELVVATDDQRIYDAVHDFGGKALMTASHHPTGTDRVAEAVSQIVCDIVVNVQGDEPLVRADMIKDAVMPLTEKTSFSVTNLITEIKNPGDYTDVTVVKAVQDKQGHLLYLTRAPIPYPKTRCHFKLYKQIGLYAFRKEFLSEFIRMPQSDLELIEGIEFLRLLENGHQIKAVLTEYEAVSVDTLSDLIEVEKILKTQSVAYP